MAAVPAATSIERGRRWWQSGDRSDRSEPLALLPAAAAPSPSPPATDDGPSRDVVEVTRGMAAAARVWMRLSPTTRGLITLAIGSMFGLGSCEAVRRWTAYEQRHEREAVPPVDMGVARDLVAERPRPAPPPEPAKPKKPGSPKPRPKPSDGDAQVDPLRQPEERRHLDCQPGPRPLDPLLCPRDARPRQPGEW